MHAQQIQASTVAPAVAARGLDGAAPATPCDVLVIGGGPAGSTAAALLAQEGRDVVLLEKDAHPRFHIGESLLPHNLGLLDRLGLLEQVKEIGVYKPGAEFVSDEHGQSIAFEFKNGLDQTWTYSFHVERAAFDKILFDHSRKVGVKALERTRVVDVAIDPTGRSRVEAVDAAGATLAFAPRFVIDASGRDTYLASKLKSKSTNKNNNTAAIFAHFKGVAPLRLPDEGNIVIHLFDDAWFWAIPLPDGITSIGLVGKTSFFKQRTGSNEEFFKAMIARSPSLAARTADAELAGPVRSTGNYSYSAGAMAGPGYILIGDAFAFIDPIFSSGVMLAMTSAERGARAVHVHLDDPVRARPLFRAFDREVRGALGAFSWLIYRINSPVLRDMFMAPRNHFKMRDGLVSLLAGSWSKGLKQRLPVLAFKTAFYFLQFAYRRGYRLRRDAGLVPIRTLKPARSA